MRDANCVWRRFFFFWLIVGAALSPLRAERLPLRVYTSADGMASSVVTHLTRDSLGFLWFATRDGLIRFDGREFTNYRLGDSNTSQTLFYIRETSDGSFWISAGDGLYKATRRETTEVVPLNDDKRGGETRPILNAEKVSDISFRVTYEDREKQVWGGANGLYLIRDADGNTVLRQIDLGEAANVERGINIRDILHGRDGSLWIACNLGVIRKLPDGRIVYYPIRRASNYDETNALAEDTSGRIIVAHHTGLFILNPEPLEDLAGVPDFSFRPPNLTQKALSPSDKISLPAKSGEMLRLTFNGFQNSTVNSVFKASDGRIWLSINNSLYFLNGSELKRITNDGDALSPIGGIIEDADGSLWLGTTSGVIKYARQGLTTFDAADGLEKPAIASIYQTDDALYVVHGDWRISRLAGDKFESVKLQMPDAARFLWSSNIALPDKSGNWWAVSEDGLYRFENLKSTAGQIYHQADGLKGNSLFCGFRDSSGNLWFSTRYDETHTGLTKLDVLTGEFQAFTSESGYPDKRSPVSFAEDKGGNYWFGFYETGMARLNRETGRFDVFTPADGVPHGVIFALHTDLKGRLWIGSSAEGLGLIENPASEKPTFAHLTIAEGLASNNVRSLTEDLRGNIYAGTVRGLDRLNPETGRVRHFSTADGLAADYVTAAFRDKSGNLWFGTPNGLSKFVPKDDLPMSPAPRVFVSGLNIAGTRYKVSVFGQKEIAGIKVGYTENNLQINFSGVGDNESLRYQYKLDGANQAWSAPSGERTVNFANLAPGSYKFLVQAISSAGMTSENPATVSFTIAPPFYRTWWFAALALISAAGLIFALDRFRVRKTRQVENALIKSKESETRFRTLAETASDAIITINEDSTIIFANEAVEKIFGYTREELIGEKLTVLMPEDLRPRHNAGLGRYAATRRKHISWAGVELPGKHKSGYAIPLELSFGDFELDGKRYFTGIARDISERKRAEDALQKSREERFAELERVRTRIATDLHDDIGSSLTQIAVLTEVARSHAQLQMVQTPLERIASVSNELVEAMSDIVWAINPRKDNLRELLQRMRRFAADVFTARAIKFDFHAPDLETKLQLGANIRREIFAHFKECVNNIIKHSEAARATVDFVIAGDVLLLKVSDDGRGFDAEKMLDANFSPEKGGNGLLNMRRRAQELGGKCEIISFAGGGSTVLLEIPLSAGSNDVTTQTGGENGNAKV